MLRRRSVHRAKGEKKNKDRQRGTQHHMRGRLPLPALCSLVRRIPRCKVLWAWFCWHPHAGSLVLPRASVLCEASGQEAKPDTMRFMIGDVEVFFPYKYIYKEQYEYMKELHVCIGLLPGMAAPLA